MAGTDAQLQVLVVIAELIQPLRTGDQIHPLLSQAGTQVLAKAAGGHRQQLGKRGPRPPVALRHQRGDGRILAEPLACHRRQGTGITVVEDRQGAGHPIRLLNELEQRRKGDLQIGTLRRSEQIRPVGHQGTSASTSRQNSHRPGASGDGSNQYCATRVRNTARGRRSGGREKAASMRARLARIPAVGRPYATA